MTYKAIIYDAFIVCKEEDFVVCGSIFGLSCESDKSYQCLPEKICSAWSCDDGIIVKDSLGDTYKVVSFDSRDTLSQVICRYKLIALALLDIK